MNRFAYYTPEGVIKQVLSTLESDPPEIEGLTALSAPQEVGVRTHHVVDGAFVEGLLDTRTLSQRRDQKRQQINAWRLAANRGSFTFAGKQIACDELSRSDIDGITSSVTLSGSLPPDFPGAWKAVDNTYVAIPDVATWSDLVAAMVQQGTQNFLRSQALKALLETYTTAEEIEAMTWDTPISQ